MADRRRRRLIAPVWAAALMGAMALGLPARAQTVLPPARLAVPAILRADDISPRSACLEAAREAERRHGLPTGLLVGIALNESGLHAHALNIAGRSYYPDSMEEAERLLRATDAGYVMAGCVQVNARVHARGSDWPLDPTRSADWAGGMMARWARETGSWSEAVRRWHGGSTASTQRLVCRIKAKMEVTGADGEVFRDWSCNNAQTARVRRNGEVHLALAENAF